MTGQEDENLGGGLLQGEAELWRREGQRNKSRKAERAENCVLSKLEARRLENELHHFFLAGGLAAQSAALIS